MFKNSLLSLFLALGASGVHGETDETLLARADAWRLPFNNAQLTVNVELWKGEEMEKARSYRVSLASQRRVLIHFLHPTERGQKFLQLQEDFWITLPQSKRPLRITPLQKLLGDAAVGDISSMRWQEDYRVETQQDCVSEDGTACVQLELEARFASLSYARITLWVDALDARPLSAAFYLASGRLAKEATFRFDAEQRRMVAMELSNALSANMVTKVRYGPPRPFEVDQRYLNPQYLVRARGDTC